MYAGPLSFIAEYSTLLSNKLAAINPMWELSAEQKKWMGEVLTGMHLTGQLNWSAIARNDVLSRSFKSHSWMFRHSPIAWGALVKSSVDVLLDTYGIMDGVLVLDDTDYDRSKNTTRIPGVHYYKNKKGGGTAKGQCVMTAVLVTKDVTLPVGVAFHVPDPAITDWNKECARLKKAGVDSSTWPKRPDSNPEYPSKREIAVELARQFHANHPSVTISAVVADAWFGNEAFMSGVKQATDTTQVISQLRSNQKVTIGTGEISLTDWVSANPGVPTQIAIRGGEPVTMYVSSAILPVKAHGKTRHIVAIRAEDEDDYRFLVAEEASWRSNDILRTYTLRWLVETFFEDWKAHDGWANLSKQTGEEGSTQGVILSLLLDHALLLHPTQQARIKAKQPLFTVGSLQKTNKAVSVVSLLQRVADAVNPAAVIQFIINRIKALYPLAESSKHMVGRAIWILESDWATTL